MIINPYVFGGVTPPPSTGQTLWLKSDTGAFSDAGTTPAVNNSTVQQWNDQSGNGNNVSQATGASRPTYKTNIVNGLPVLRFDGGDFLTAAAIATIFGFTGFGFYFTLYVVVAATNTAATNDAGSPWNNQAIFTDKTNGNFGVNWKNGTPIQFVFDGSTTTVASDAVANNTFAVVEAIKDQPPPLTNASAIYIRTDNGTQSTGTDGLNGGGTLSVGGGFSVNLTGDIAEVIAYNRTLDSTETQTVRTYLGARYGLF